jgi:archaeal flagellar protein FlaI
MTININPNPRVPSLERVEDKTKIDVRYMVISPFASIHIYWDTQAGELIYNVEEPLLSKKEKENLENIKSSMREILNINLFEESNKENLVNYIEKTARLVINQLGFILDEKQFQKIFYYLYRDFIGLNEIDPIMKDYFIEDIECNGIGEPIYLVHRVFRNLKTNVKFSSLDALGGFVEKLAQKTGRYISYASPILDGSLPDGSRVNATYTKDITTKGPTFTIRKFTKIPWTPIQLIEFKTVSPEILAYFWILLENKANLMICGGTASGKTTLLNALAFFIPPENRVVSIEDTRELNLPRENWLPSVVRTGTSQKEIGNIDMFSLLKGSFRQNPDYVIVGEVRGKEASVLFQGMASGHASISTLHADSVETLIQRLQTPPISLSPMLVNSLDAVAIMTHTIIDRYETRRLREITEITNVQPDGSAQTNTPIRWNPSNDQFYFIDNMMVFQKISQKTGIPLEQLKQEFSQRTKLLFTMYQKGIKDYENVQQIINGYYKNPKEVLARFGIA